MPVVTMRAREQDIIERTRDFLASIESRSATSLQARRDGFEQGLRGATDALFEQSEADFRFDIATMNGDPGWASNQKQTPDVRAKVFGGDPQRLTHGEYVLHLSLNHYFDGNPNREEYQHLSTHETHYNACTSYFRGPFFYEKFFHPRARLMRQYEFVRTGAVPADTDRALLERTTLFIEQLPTFSPQSQRPRVDHGAIFCVALNTLVLRFILQYFPPRAMLIAGNQAHHSADPWLATPQWSEFSVPQQGTKNPGCYRIGLNKLGLGSRCAVPVLRCGFLRTRSGPNSYHDVERVGRLLGGEVPDPAWAHSNGTSKSIQASVTTSRFSD